MSSASHVRVLIPSIGRDSITNNLNAIIEDAIGSGLVPEIYIGLNGKVQDHVRNMKYVKVLDISDHPYGVGNTFNSSLRLIEPGLLWIIADDDLWLPGKFDADLRLLDTWDSCTLLLPKCFYSDGMRNEIRPRISPINEDLKNYLYGHFSYTRNPRYITMSGACADVLFWRRVKFSNLESREDITFLFEQEKLGIKILQHELPTVRINIQYARSISRESSIEVTKKWALEYLNVDQITKFLCCVYAKPFSINGNFQILKKNYLDFKLRKEIGFKNSTKVWISYLYWKIIFILLNIMKFKKVYDL